MKSTIYFYYYFLFYFNSYLCGRLLIDCSYFKCIYEHTPAILIGQIKKYSVFLGVVYSCAHN